MRIEGGGVGSHARQCRRGAAGVAGRGNSARGSRRDRPKIDARPSPRRHFTRENRVPSAGGDS
ncbi:hypothetical protein X805_06370 [Sphaerotilus natans subsp. natans DSM 6575]|uniref:Uncharacterized protein n=1 Tax=Sphaerotilus natans subsp. natans DSM 6575 TaxID=1286631 RepID=A0A059KRN7_9BURK|nr:hypothetical protein X805_06370 [Sphaerotilus natans subsp. natans DSM 6575]